MKKKFFNLQLFAEDAGNTEGAAGGEPAPAENQTILGGTNEPESNNAEGSNPPAENKPEQNVPDAYDFSNIVPDGMEFDQKSADEFGNLARECGLTQEQASKLASYGMQYMQTGVNAAMQQITAQREGWAKESREQLGADFDNVTAKAAVGISKLEQKIPGLKAMLNETGAGDRIEMIRFMAAVGEMLSEDTGHGVPGYGGQKTLYPKTNFGLYK